MKHKGVNKGKKIKIKPDWKWISTAFGTTIGISATMSFLSNEVLSGGGLVLSFVVLLSIVLLGILFDIIGMSVTAAEEKPFHSMAAKKVPEAPIAIWMLRRAERVSSICNDVVGDICGVVSGSASATIAAQILSSFELSFASVVPLILSSLVAALTVGGKAVGKGIAVASCTDIVYHAGQVIYLVTHWKDLFRRKKGNTKKKK